MKKLVYLLAMVWLFAACEKPIEKPKDAGVVWDLANITGQANPGGRENEYGMDQYPECIDMPAFDVFLVVNGTEYTVKMTGLEDQTEVLKLPVGTYEVTEFVVRAIDGTHLWTVPQAGSAAAEAYGLVGLPFEFEVLPFEKHIVHVDVICYNPASYELFGYSWFQYTIYEENEICLFGDVCTKFFEDYHKEGSPYFGQPYDGYDFPAIFDVMITRGQDTVAFASNMEWQGVGAPLCVKYLDNPVVDEDFTLTIMVYTPDGNAEIVYQEDLPDGISSEQGNPEGFGGADGVFDFAVGNCDSNGNVDANLILPAYIPLPDQLEFMLSGDVYAGYGYVAMYIQNSNATPEMQMQDGGPFTAFCGALTETIVRNTWYPANIYSSLDLDDIPAEYAGYNYGALNWLVNNWGALSDVAKQAAIWAITNNTSPTTMSTEALTHSDYVPKVGEYAIVLVDPIEVPEVKENIQLQVVIVDP